MGPKYKPFGEGDIRRDMTDGKPTRCFVCNSDQVWMFYVPGRPLPQGGWCDTCESGEGSGPDDEDDDYELLRGVATGKEGVND